MKHGRRTRRIAENLHDKLQADSRYSGVKLFYDHGDSSKKEVCQPTSYMGRRYGSDATLSGLDIVLTHKDRVILVVEVEESEVRPKTVLGDIFGVLLAGKVRIRGRSYPLVDTIVVVALASSGQGRKDEKYARLERHISGYVQALRQTKPGTSVKKVRIITAPLDDLVRRIERLIRLEVGKTVRA